MKWTKLIFALIVLFCAACQSNKKVDESVKDTTSENIDTTLVPSIDTSSSVATINRSMSNPNGIVVSCDAVGKINIGDTYADVVKKAGIENVKLDSVFVKGIFQNSYATKVWEGTAGEITINWQESKQPYLTIQNIIIDNLNSNYVVQNGIKIGSKISLINKLNGKPFSLIGFKGSDGGTLVNFNEGNLLSQIPCLRVVFVMPKMTSYPKEVNTVLTSNMVQSDHIAFKIYDPTIVKLIINSKR